ncbi:MAG: Holliday junction resolvase RuvX [bacterium]
MRILGLDIGEKVIGAAISDPLKTIAQGIESIKRLSIKEDIENIKRLINDYEVEKLVIGLPKMMNGKIGIQAQKVINFVQQLENEIDIPIIMTDERLTTVIADKVLIEGNMRRKKRKQTIDKVAATLILQGYLDSYVWR